MSDNHTFVTEGFRILRDALSLYIGRELEIEFGKDWWGQAVVNTLDDKQRRGLPATGKPDHLLGMMDIAQCLLLFDIHWGRVFRKRLSVEHRGWAKELLGVRNKLAHLGADDYSHDDTWRALDTMSRLSEQIDSVSNEQIRAILRKFRYGSDYDKTTLTDTPPSPSPEKQKSLGILDTPPQSGLLCWRDIVRPHPDVARGEYKNAEFAADLSQVARGEGAMEYSDAREFFARTYVTEGMTGLLREALLRVTGKGGEPVIQLKTAFGGGKTHSMLALFHMMRGKVSADKIPNLSNILEAEAVSKMPKVNVAVLVGTAMNPNGFLRPNNMPGITKNTFWGEMAAQLAYSAGKPELYDLVKQSDKNGVSPSSVVFKELFDKAGPCVVLIDELVAYARKLYKVDNLPAGTFDNFISFIQEVTEAARASKNSLVVVSIPESNMEIGGEAGQKVLETLDHVFSRMQSIWKPVTSEEGFKVVRLRLFLDCHNEQARDEVCESFSRMYRKGQNEFPIETGEVAYLERMKSCYPIHPEVFDRLYQDWATLEKFQRTRGVLRLMAAVIHELWMNSDSGLMIMPSSFPLSLPDVRNELTRNLPETWSSIVDREVDGKNSIPYQTDQSVERYGFCMAARRVARTVLLGSAPTVRGQNIRGIETAKIRLGTVQPGENISTFADALSTLADTLAYLYKGEYGERYWYDTRPSLAKTAKDRASQMADTQVMSVIEERLQKIKRDPLFTAIHCCPGSSGDVPDDPSARLVILPPTKQYKNKDDDSIDSAMSTVNDYLKNRGSTPRSFRNMLIFLVADADKMSYLKEEIKLYLAWVSIEKDKDTLNLDGVQMREMRDKLKDISEKVSEKINDTYCRLLVPRKELSVDFKTVEWNIHHIPGKEDILNKVSKLVTSEEYVIVTWAPMLLLNELNKPLQSISGSDAPSENKTLWKDTPHIYIKDLWDCLCKYLYLPRLREKKVLIEAIRAGLPSAEYFAFASGYDGARYIGLKYNQSVNNVEDSGLLVQTAAAQQQITTEEKEKALREETTSVDAGNIRGISTANGSDIIKEGSGIPVESGATITFTPKNKKYTHFHMTATIVPDRIVRDIPTLYNEIIKHLNNTDQAQVAITLEVVASSQNGFTNDIISTVSQNCKDSKVKVFSFEE